MRRASPEHSLTATMPGSEAISSAGMSSRDASGLLYAITGIPLAVTCS